MSKWHKSAFFLFFSTGAIIASFLGFHKKSIAEIEETYTTLGFKIFTQNILDGETLQLYLQA
jgi:hypothetical protein